MSNHEQRWNLVQRFKKSAEFERLTTELYISRESAIIAIGKFIDFLQDNNYTITPNQNKD
ncbi:MAG: hypothetical protein KAR20_07550 [Candidatus Heimdallarchaeota archaeon]|nr:hypothetical protein [Candidatus Heimdallarchaeota archaeon]